jgi:hypothetical protein
VHLLNSLRRPACDVSRLSLSDAVVAKIATAQLTKARAARRLRPKAVLDPGCVKTSSRVWIAVRYPEQFDEAVHCKSSSADETPNGRQAARRLQVIDQDGPAHASLQTIETSLPFTESTGGTISMLPKGKSNTDQPYRSRLPIVTLGWSIDANQPGGARLTRNHT